MKPTRLKELMGNPGKRPLPVEPEYPELDMEPPADLCDAAKEEWRRLAPMQIGNRIVTAADFSVFKDYCRSKARCDELYEMIEKEGAYFNTSSGDKKPHPAVRQLSSERNYLNACRVQLGLTPVSRAKTPPGKAKHDETNIWEVEMR